MSTKTLDKLLYPVDLIEASKLQKEMAACVEKSDRFAEINYWGGVDVSNNPRDPKQMIYAAIVVLDQDLQVKQQTKTALKQSFPYIPGYLGFRESPAIIQAWHKLTLLPDVLMVDGHGISHPRGLGIASHLGVLLDIPTIGVAKSILVGQPAQALNLNPGARVPLLWRGDVIAMLLRTKARSNPLIISTGHRVSLDTACNFVWQCLQTYRLPEPTRLAHQAANICRKTFQISESTNG